MCVCVQSLNRVQLCDPMNCSPPGSSVHEILQARKLECPLPSPVDLLDPGIKLASSVYTCIGRPILYH